MKQVNRCPNVAYTLEVHLWWSFAWAMRLLRREWYSQQNAVCLGFGNIIIRAKFLIPNGANLKHSIMSLNLASVSSW